MSGLSFGCCAVSLFTKNSSDQGVVSPYVIVQPSAQNNGLPNTELCGYQ